MPIYIDASKTTVDDNPALTPTQHFPYLSLYTFLAKLTISPQLPTFDFTEYAIWEFRDVLERWIFPFPKSTQPPPELPHFIKLLQDPPRPIQRKN
jgi:hypothetical protein